VTLLLEYNADVNKKDHRGRTPLHVAVKGADCAIARALLCHGADIHAVDMTGNNPLQVASRFGHIELVRLLLEHNASLFTRNQKGPSPLHISASEGHVPLLDLFAHYVDLNVLSVCDDQLEKAPLHLCAEKGYIEAVRFLLERHSVDVNVLTSKQQTALHVTLNQMHDPKHMRRKEDFDLIVDLLIKKGINVNQPDNCGNSALHLAALHQHHKAAELLIMSPDTDLHIRNKDSLLAVDLIPGFDLCMKQIFAKYSAFASGYLANGGRHTPGCPCSPKSGRSSVDGLTVTFDKISLMAEPTAPSADSTIH
jgi:ankyrin repeat protein